MLYLVPKTPRPSPKEVISQQTDVSTSPVSPYKQRFLSDIQERSSNLFSFYAQDARYDLRCSMLLDIQHVLAPEDNAHPKEEWLVPMIVGDFPGIDGELLFEKAFGNKYIQEILTLRFYLNVLESLFLFCEDMNASGLILTLENHNFDVIEAYQNFIISEARVMTNKGEQIQVMISVDPQTNDDLLDFIKKVNEDFRQTLWRKQWGNPILREYLKSYALTDF